MRPPSVLLAAAIAIFPAAARAAATIEGRVALPPAAAAPPPPPGRYEVEPERIATPDPPAAVVWVEGVRPAGGAARAEMAQRGFQFAPGTLAVARGGIVAFPN